jgi:two-component system copper resistance phosphate regulon response regulator CusR
MPRILVVEDQKTLRQSLVRGLEGAGYEVFEAATGDDAARLAIEEQVEVVVLDLMLPGKGGLEVLGELRTGGFASPVLILTARDSVDSRVAGLDRGADDYLVKPFAFAELLARLRALSRRGPVARASSLRVADLELDLIARRVSRAGKAVELTSREFELLEYLIRHKDVPLSRDTISIDVWKEPTGAMTNVIDVYINALRKKVERAGSEPLIQTVRGVGYVLRDLS